MAEPRTEAACLLETGALYRERIGLQPIDGGDLLFAGFKQGAFSLYFGDAPIYHFDRDGRWQRAYVDGYHYLKGLDAEVHEIDRVREGPNLVLHRRRLASAEAADLDARFRSVALDLMTGLAEGRFRRDEPPEGKARPLVNEALRDFLDRIGRWDGVAWSSHRERYDGTYGPLPFLPPECQNAVVVQATLGHAGGRSFGLSAPAEPHVRVASEFAQHVGEVATLWGRRLLQSKVVFLAGPDVLRQPASQVAEYLDALGRVLPIRRKGDEDGASFEGVHAFCDDFSGEPYGVEDWRRLADRGLGRVSLGVESGDPAVRALYAKHWDDGSLRSTVTALKSAGLGVSVLTLVGAGGAQPAEPHVERTVRLIDSLDLGRGDFVFLLDEDEVGGARASSAGMTLADRAAWADQQVRLRTALAPLKDQGIKVLPYTLEKQWT